MAKVHLRKDPLWGRPCLGYSVQGRFDDRSLARLAAFQSEVLRGRSAGLHRTPAGAMHISVFSIVPVRWPDAGKDDLWTGLKAGVLEAIASADPAEGLAIRFEETRVTETAVILSTPEQPAPIRRLRDSLNALVVAAGLPAQAFDRTHLTLARPARDRLLDAASVAELERTRAKVEVRLHAMKLIRERVYPSLEIEVLS
ncbi:hypothetical protein [Phenylobacterium sp.]|jgi:hypothetical protein|uniref:hypothetical protein n=1 Tax=Phenylobacterium sp. TaxID=1871053 RepID=UPI002F40C714